MIITRNDNWITIWSAQSFNTRICYNVSKATGPWQPKLARFSFAYLTRRTSFHFIFTNLHGKSIWKINIWKSKELSLAFAVERALKGVWSTFLWRAVEIWFKSVEKADKRACRKQNLRLSRGGERRSKICAWWETCWIEKASLSHAYGCRENEL